MTAAQSAFAVAALSNLRISVAEAAGMLGLFLVQLVTRLPLFEPIHTEARITVGIVYLALAAGIALRNRRLWPAMMRDGLRRPITELVDP